MVVQKIIKYLKLFLTEQKHFFLAGIETPRYETVLKACCILEEAFLFDVKLGATLQLLWQEICSLLWDCGIMKARNSRDV